MDFSSLPDVDSDLNPILDLNPLKYSRSDRVLDRVSSTPLIKLNLDLGIRFILLQRSSNLIDVNGFVRRSTSCSSVLTYLTLSSQVAALSRMKWMLTSVCFVLEWNTCF